MDDKELLLTGSQDTFLKVFIGVSSFFTVVPFLVNNLDDIANSDAWYLAITALFFVIYLVLPIANYVIFWGTKSSSQKPSKSFTGVIIAILTIQTLIITQAIFEWIPLKSTLTQKELMYLFNGISLFFAVLYIITTNFKRKKLKKLDEVEFEDLQKSIKTSSLHATIAYSVVILLVFFTFLKLYKAENQSLNSGVKTFFHLNQEYKPFTSHLNEMSNWGEVMYWKSNFLKNGIAQTKLDSTLLDTLSNMPISRDVKKYPIPTLVKIKKELLSSSKQLNDTLIIPIIADPTLQKADSALTHIPAWMANPSINIPKKQAYVLWLNNLAVINNNIYKGVEKKVTHELASALKTIYYPGLLTLLTFLLLLIHTWHREYLSNLDANIDHLKAGKKQKDFKSSNSIQYHKDYILFTLLLIIPIFQPLNEKSLNLDSPIWPLTLKRIVQSPVQPNSAPSFQGPPTEKSNIDLINLERKVDALQLKLDTISSEQAKRLSDLEDLNKRNAEKNTNQFHLLDKRIPETKTDVTYKVIKNSTNPYKDLN